MSENLVDLVLNYKSGDKNAINNLLKEFEPLVMKYSRGLDIDDSKQEFIVVLIEVIDKMVKTMSEKHMHKKFIVAYVVRSLRNKRNMVIREKYNKSHKEIVLCDNMDNDFYTYDKEASEKELELSVSESQREVIKLKYLFKYNNKEVCDILKISNKQMKTKEMLALNHIRTTFINKL